MRILAPLLLAACAADEADEADEADTAQTCDVDLTATGWSAQTHLKGVDGDYALLFDDDTVHRIDITLCAADAEAMEADLESLFGDMSDALPEGDPPESGGGAPPEGEAGGPDFTELADPMYVPVTVAFDGRTWPAVGMRYKGNSSLMQPYLSGISKLPFRLNFDYYDDVYPEVDDQRFHGFEELKFGNAYGDDSLVRDKVAADLFRAAGVPAARGAMVEIYVDAGEGPVYWGVYTMSEDVCGELLDSWFDDDDGNCYKADGEGATLASFDAASFENKTNDDDSAADVEALVDALGDGSLSDEDWRAALEERFDVDAFLRYLAVNNLIGNWDSYGLMTHNYYLYGDPAQDGRLVWVPWDFNLSFAASNVSDALSITMDEVEEDWPLIRTLMDDAVYAELYYSHLEELVEGELSVEAQEERFAQAHALVAESAAAETAAYTNVTSSFDDALEGTDDAVFDWIEDANAAAVDALDMR